MAPLKPSRGVQLCGVLDDPDSKSSTDLSLATLEIDDVTEIMGTLPPATPGTSGNNSLHKIIIGVDFGTTYTGISYVDTSGSKFKSLDDVHCITSWPGPGREGDSAWKTPSRIAYVNENDTAQNAWGYSVTPRMRAYTWMKLCLDPVQATEYDDPSLENSEGEGVLRLPPGKSAIDVCADYLQEVAVFAYDTLKQRLSPEVLAMSPLEFWFTVPAVWSDKAKANSLRVAEQAASGANLFLTAGGSVFLIAEPEAAAVAAVASVTEGGVTQQIKPNDNILVCDCGGGTVDITTYTVASLHPCLEFREYLIGTGGKCGSTYIDRQFLMWMEQKFGTAFTSLPREKRGPGSRFMKEFENHKRDFGVPTDSNRHYEMTLPMKLAQDSKYYDIQEQEVKLYHDDLKKLFDPVVKKIVTLVESQVNEDIKQAGHITIKTIILVGGFGDSRYLNQVLRSWCETRGNIRLICPEYPQAAIVRGAALSGLHNLRPSSRRARRHYGIQLDYNFDKSRHDPKYRYTDVFDGHDYARGYMNWILRKGDSITEDTERKIICWRNLRSDSNLKYDVQIYKCDADDAPRRYDEPGTQKLAKIAVDLTNFDLSRHKSKLKDGKKLIEMEFNLHVKFGSRCGVLCFQYLVDDKMAGSTLVNFDDDVGSSNRDGTIDVNGKRDDSACVAM